MEESEDNMSSEDLGKVDGPSAVRKPKKRSLVERELETNLTARVTSPAAFAQGSSTSRYGRARRMKTDAEFIGSQKVLLASVKSSDNENTPVLVQSPVYRMYASNSPHKPETPKKASVTYLDNQIDNIYQENISLSRFSDETCTPSPAKKFPKVYIRKDLIQNREEEETVMLIKNLFSPSKNASKLSSFNLSDNSVHSTEKYNAKHNGLVDNSSVVKTLDFDSKRKKKKEQKGSLSKNELFEVEAKCLYQVGDLAWARVGTFPFWPCMVTRDPYSEMFVKKKLFGRVEHDIIHVTFFGDNGRRSWIVDNMLRKYQGLLQFQSTREQFTLEDKKKDPKLYAAFFVSEKKQALWNASVEEADSLLREPKRLRIDIFNDMLWKSRTSKNPVKSGKISSRNNSDVSLSESLYDSLFSVKGVKADDAEHSKKSRNKSFDVSEVVTACLDNMAAKTGITKIQRQSHMDRWLQKAKSKTPEKTQAKPAVMKLEKPEKVQVKPSAPVKLTRKSSSKIMRKPVPSPSVNHAKPYRFTRRTESHHKLVQIESKSDLGIEGTSSQTNKYNKSITKSEDINSISSDINVSANVDKENISSQDISIVVIIDNDDNTTQSKNESIIQSPGDPVNDSAMDTIEVKQLKSVTDKASDTNQINSAVITIDDDLNESKNQADVESTTNEANDTLSIAKKVKHNESCGSETIDTSSVVDTSVTSLQSKNEFNAEAITQQNQDTELSETIEKGKEITSTYIDVKSQNLEANNTYPMEMSKEYQDVSPEANSKRSVSNVNYQDSLMEVDENTNGVKIVQDKIAKLKCCISANNSVMKADKCTYYESEVKGETSPNSETVSNKSVGTNVTDLKEAQNIVTIEVSVTEKKNDDTLNNLPHEGEQGSINNLNPSPLSDTKKNDLIFLDVSNNHNTSNIGVNDIITPRNSSTPEKYKRHETKRKSNNFSRKTLHIETNIFCNEKEVIKLKDDINKSSALMENGVLIDHEINDKNKTLDCRNDVFNESGNSESILQLYTDGPELEQGEAILETPFSNDISSESILESSQSNENVNENFSKKETAENIGNETEVVAEENRNGSIRQYVESPTFTQLLESEEFFRDVNETHNSCTKFETKSSKQCPELQKITIYEDVKNTKSFDSNKVEDFEDEDTSEDEPSPEYESLDDEITEDFRKHMMSIENNIKDKKDDEQIVKICNEIAEKAKLSPTKYTQDNKIVNHFVPNEKLCTNLRSFHQPLINLKEKNAVKLKEKDSILKEKANTSSLDEHHIKTDDSSIKKQNKSIVHHTVLTKDLNRSDIQTIIDKQTDVVPEKNEDCKVHIEDINLKMNSNATSHEISDNPKIIYRTRSSIRSASKGCASPEIKVESSIVEQYRKSCEYEPKVVIIRLERDKIDLSIGANKPKPLDEDKCKNNKSRISLNGSSNDNKHIENKIIENEKDKSKNRKSRLSLQRHSPKSKEMSEIQHSKSENFTKTAIKKKEIEITTTKVPKKIDIMNNTCGTGIPEPVKVKSILQNLETIFTDTPDLVDDTDFDVEAVSLNSDDSEVSLPNSVECTPKRNLRPRAERTLEFALKDPKFLEYLELRQDYVIELYPELNDDEVLNYVHKSWQYQRDLESDTNKVADVCNSLKQETHSQSKKSIKSQPKHSIENHFRKKYENSKKTIDFDSESGTIPNCIEAVEQKVEFNMEESMDKTELPVKWKKHSKSPDYIDLTSDKTNDTHLDKDKRKDIEAVSVNSEENMTLRKSSRSRMTKSLDKQIYDVKDKSTPKYNLKKEQDIDTESVDSEDSEIPLRQLRSMVMRENNVNGIKKETSPEKKVDEVSASDEPIVNNDIKEEGDELASTVSDNEPLLKQKTKRIDKHSVADPEFIQYLKQTQDTLMDENPQLTQNEIVQFLHKTWLYGENSKSAVDKSNELKQSNLVKGLNNDDDASSKKVRRRPKVEKIDASELTPKEKPKRRLAQPFYDENYSDIEEEIELFEIFKPKKSAITVVSKAETEKVKSPPSKSPKGESLKVAPQMEQVINIDKDDSDVEYVDETEIYFTELTTPKPNIFKGLIREKVCEICECAGSLVKCKGCYGMFHSDCVKKQIEPTEKVKEYDVPLKGRKKKRKSIRKPKSLEDSESLSDEKSHDMSADTSLEDIVLPEVCTIDAEYFESQLEVKMKEILEAADSNINYDSYSSDDGIDWESSVPGKCEIVDVKLKRRAPPIDYSDYKCHNCQKNDVPLCFVCKSAVSKTEVKMRQKCHVAHCHKYYHLECLDHWPQTQFNSGEPSRNNKKKNQFFETLMCPRHVCHTCVSDDPRGCKTRFSGDKLAKCVRCPATYHSFNKCLPAGSQVLTASHIICPRHSEQKAGKVSCHVNTGWCFICALGGSLICCEYCPTSFHAECLNIKPPEGNYMCEDCETGRLPLYGEMVWVKLGQYRWWPGKILHPSEIPENIMLVKHDLGDFVVRFFGQYDHFWVNRGRVFPYQEGDSGRISSQKSKINADFILAIEHAQRAYNILKNAMPDEEESLDIASSLLPPRYVKLKSNKASGSLCGRKVDDPSLSLTQCECNPEEPEPCGPYSQCLNRMLLTECGPTCRAGDRCNNRAFEKRLYPKLTPYRTPQRGWGLKTLEDVKAGQFVIEYVGELIDEEEFRRRMRRKHEIRDENFYFLTLDKERMIDAGPKGNVARFMNHCCEPNCETQKWTVLGDVRVGLFAIDDIPANSEVTFNYNLECTGIEKKRCLCGAKRCSGYIGAKPKQDDSQSKKGKVKKTFNKKKKPESPSTSKTKKKLSRPSKPKELTDLEEDVLIIKNATNISSDESLSTEDKSPKLKGKISSNSTEKVSLCNGQLEDKTKSLKRKRVSISTAEVSICNGQEPCVKKQKCNEPSEVGD